MDLIIISKEDFDSFKNEIIQEVTRLIRNSSGADEKIWLRTRDVCKLLNLSTSSLQNLRNSGKIPFTKLNGIILYRREDIEAILTELSRGGDQ